jgi:hypothetical protein
MRPFLLAFVAVTATASAWPAQAMVKSECIIALAATPGSGRAVPDTIEILAGVGDERKRPCPGPNQVDLRTPVASATARNDVALQRGLIPTLPEEGEFVFPPPDLH